MGHNYIEQGQHSYMKIPLFNPKKLRLIDKFNINWKNKLSHRDEDAHFYFSDDAEFFIGINEDIYPCVPDNKKIILSNISSLKNLYKPKLKGVSFIGLTCATRRVNKIRNIKASIAINSNIRKYLCLKRYSIYKNATIINSHLLLIQKYLKILKIFFLA